MTTVEGEPVSAIRSGAEDQVPSALADFTFQQLQSMAQQIRDVRERANSPVKRLWIRSVARTKRAFTLEPVPSIPEIALVTSARADRCIAGACDRITEHMARIPLAAAIARIPTERFAALEYVESVSDKERLDSYGPEGLRTLSLMRAALSFVQSGKLPESPGLPASAPALSVDHPGSVAA